MTSLHCQVWPWHNATFYLICALGAKANRLTQTDQLYNSQQVTTVILACNETRLCYLSLGPLSCIRQSRCLHWPLYGWHSLRPLCCLCQQPARLASISAPDILRPNYHFLRQTLVKLSSANSFVKVKLLLQ